MKKLITLTLITAVALGAHAQSKIFLNQGTPNGIGTSNNGYIGFGPANSTPTAHMHFLDSFNGEINFILQNSYNGGTRTFLTSTPTKSLIQTDRDFSIATNGGGWSDKLTVLNNGNVGIGTSTINDRLSVQGTFGLLGAGLDGSLLQRTVFYSDATNGMLIDVAKNNTGAKLDIQFNWRGGGSPALFVKGTTSNVGIGTTTPERKLHVDGGVSGSSFMLGNTTSVNRTSLWLNTEGETGKTYIQSWWAGVNQGVLALNPSGGNVGVGVADPLNVLDVNGVSRFRRQNSTTAGLLIGGDALTLRGWGANNPYIEWRNSNDTRQGYMGWNTNRLSLVLENGHNFTVENGSVGIGTSSPDAKLAVKGTVHAQEVKVDMLGSMVPDYVFEPTYHLPSLESIKTYIDQNKHLPEVPSAKEMEANGVNLGEMNMLLLKKVEELTLYLIAQREQTEKLQKEHDRAAAISAAKLEELMEQLTDQRKEIAELKRTIGK